MVDFRQKKKKRVLLLISHKEHVETTQYQGQLHKFQSLFSLINLHCSSWAKVERSVWAPASVESWAAEGSPAIRQDEPCRARKGIAESTEIMKIGCYSEKEIVQLQESWKVRFAIWYIGFFCCFGDFLLLLCI